jgi:hypothetical protein
VGGFVVDAEGGGAGRGGVLVDCQWMDRMLVMMMG